LSSPATFHLVNTPYRANSGARAQGVDGCVDYMLGLKCSDRRKIALSNAIRCPADYLKMELYLSQ
jgi:hypothetical protein